MPCSSAKPSPSAVTEGTNEFFVIKNCVRYRSELSVQSLSAFVGTRCFFN